VLIVEEASPSTLKQAACQILRQHDVNTRIVGQGPVAHVRRYSVDVLRKGLGEFLNQWAPQLRSHAGTVAARKTEVSAVSAAKLAALVPPDLPGCATGCPERPFFAAMKICRRKSER